jgi:hypothetical protein
MAEKQEHKVSVGDRVRIKDSVTHMYPSARAYNEGWVRALQHDKFGYPMIYVEWDHDHWAYSGEENGWTDEAHFDLVEGSMPENDEKFDALLNGLGELVSQFRDTEEPQGDDESKPDRKMEGHKMSYEEVLKRAHDDAQEGEAYIVIVARTEEFNGNEIVNPRVYMHSKREDAALLLDAAMADVVAQTYSKLALGLIAEAKRNGSFGS